jgi:hypothetical protein
VQEMDPQTIDRGDELRHGVEAPLGRTPVVTVRPARAAFLQALECDALTWVGGRLGPARRSQTRAEVLQVGVRDGKSEWLDHRAHARALMAWARLTA